MSLENATYIHQLLVTNPTIQDKMKQGDDHLRMIKAALRNTFPQILGPVQVSHTTLNNLPSNTAAVINALYAAREARGSIKMHDIVNVPAIPAGWSLCDGSIVPGYGVVPDMRNAFIRGWGDEAAGVTGGSLVPGTTGTAGAHTHTATSGAHALTVSELPVHHHQMKGSFSQGGYAGGGNDFFRIRNSNAYADSGEMADEGGGAAHTHPDGTTDSQGSHSHSLPTIVPPYIRVVFIVKTTDFQLP